MRIFFVYIIFLSFVNQLHSQVEFDERFSEFWGLTVKELNEIPFNVREIRTEEFENKKISLFKIKSYGNIDFHIYVSEPIEEGKYETRIMFSPFGERDYSFDKVSKDSFMNKKGVISVKVDNRGQGLSREVIGNDRFLLNGIKEKETYVYRGVFMDVVRSVDFISKHEKSNGVIVAFGGSQGGMLALVAGALNNKIDIVIARIPFFAGINKYNKERWPMNWILPTSLNERGITNEKQLEELEFYDVKNFANLLKIPVYIGACENDPITPPQAILEAFVNIKNKDKMIYIVSPCNSHGYKSDIDDEISEIFLDLQLKLIYQKKGL